MSLSHSSKGADKCALPFFDPNGQIVFFDIQPAEPGTFTVPGVIDLEVYRPGDIVETSWIYFKGDPQAGPQPGHPFERPFNDSAKFSIDIVRDNDTSVVLHEIMRKSPGLLLSPRDNVDRNTAPTNSSAFWEGGAPFGRPSRYSMYIPRLDSSCKYYFIGEMIYLWKAPKHIEGAEGDSALRLKLTTDTPSTTHFSGKFRLSHDDATFSSSMRVEHLEDAGFSTIDLIGVASAVVVMLLLSFWVIIRLGRRSQRIVLD